MSMMNGAPIVYLIGLAGTGKLTVAREMARQRPDYLVVDNHKINNVVFSLLDLKGPVPDDAWEAVERIRDSVLSALPTLISPERPVVLTNDLDDDDPWAWMIFYKVAVMAQKRQTSLIPIRLVCSQEELVRRGTTPERARAHKNTDERLLADRANSRRVLEPPHGFSTLTLDTTSLTPSDAAAEIFSHIDALVTG